MCFCVCLRSSVFVNRFLAEAEADEESAADVVEDDNSDPEWRGPLETKIYGNLGLASLKLDDYTVAQDCCARVLLRDPQNVKAKFHLSKVRQRCLL